MHVGLIRFRASKGTKAFISAWESALDADAKLWDQYGFINTVKQGGTQLHPNISRVFLAFGGKATLGILPVASFCNGDNYFVQHLYEVS